MKPSGPLPRYTAEPVACASCGEALTDEEVAQPEHDSEGDAICVQCWDDECRGDCGRCGERVEKSELLDTPGALIGVWRDAPGLGGDVRCGYYRVTAWPFYAWGMIEGHFYNDALAWVGPLDDAGRRAGEEADTMAGPMCADCRNAVEAGL